MQNRVTAYMGEIETINYGFSTDVSLPMLHCR